MHIMLAMQGIHIHTELHNNLNFQAFAAPAVSRSLMSRVAPDKINNNGYYVVSFSTFSTHHYPSIQILCMCTMKIQNLQYCVFALLHSP